jgi:hypothetical protein
VPGKRRSCNHLPSKQAVASLRDIFLYLMGRDSFHYSVINGFSNFFSSPGAS